MVSEFMDRDGNKVAPDDPKRELWYSVTCGFWTDDWSKVRARGMGIPCCPVCGQVGMQTNAADWGKGAKEFDEKQPGYNAFLNANKEHCFGRAGLMNAWKSHQAKISEQN